MPKNIDQSNLRQIILDFPSQLETGLRLAEGVKAEGQFENIVVCGMGGSAWPGELVNTYLIDLKIPLYVSRDYFLPKETTKNSLIFTSSYSGDTEETLSMYREAKKRGLKIIAFTKGGALAKLCQEDGTSVVQYPDLGPGYEPRYATGLMFSAFVKVLANSGLIASKDNEIKEAADFLKQNNKEAEGKEIAKKLKKQIPLIYSREEWKIISFIWKIKFNETAKVMAFADRFSEMNHNDLTGFTLSKKQGHFCALFLRDQDDHERVKVRMELTKNILEKLGVKVLEINSQGASRLERIFSLINQGDWIAYYLALAYKVDPAPTEIQREFKKQLATR